MIMRNRYGRIYNDAFIQSMYVNILLDIRCPGSVVATCCKYILTYMKVE